MTTTASKTTPGITEPDKDATQDFSQPITFRWDPGKIPDKDVRGWWLCVGTLETGVEKGDWNILSGDMRRNRHLTIDVSDRQHVEGFKGLRVQLLCSVQDNEVDPHTGKSLLDPPERTMVPDPIVFVSNKYRSVVEALNSIAADQEEKKKQQQQTAEHHPM